MLDINYIRDHQEEVIIACKNKQLDPSIITSLIKVDEERRALLTKIEAFRAQANDHASTIKTQVAGGQKPTSDQIAKGKEIKEQIKLIEPDLQKAEQQFRELMLCVPNPAAADVPIGKDENANVVVKKVGTPKKFSFKPKSHLELMEALDWLDTKRATRIAGFRGYFLKNKGLLLEQALLAYAQKMMIDNGFTPMSAPSLVNRETMEGTGYFPWGKEDHYKTQDDQILAGTAEVALTAYYMGETLSEKDLPIKMVGISPCFRREIGSYGKDLQGVVRVHQFNKVEQVVYIQADEDLSREWHEKMTGFSEKLLQDLELPYQQLLMCTGDMGAGQRKKYDLETWFPSQEKYRETHSASYFNDFQARRLNIRYRAKDGTLKFVYTLNNTVAASPRLLAAIVENYQQADGSVSVPAVLEMFMYA